MKTGPERMETLSERMKTGPERMETVPDRMEIVAENVPTGIAWRGPCRNPDCDHDAGQSFTSARPLKAIFPTTHDMTHSRNM